MTRFMAISFDPLLHPLVLAALAFLAGLALMAASRGKLRGALWRALTLVALLIALVNPSLESGTETPLGDIVIAVVDDSASQRLSDRAAQTEAALERLRQQVAALPNTELRIIRVGDSDENGGTLLMAALARAVAQEPRDRIAGAVLITDGRVHDPELVPSLPAPLQVLLTGQPTDWDRRIAPLAIPAFAVVGEEGSLTLKVEDQGAAPGETNAVVLLALNNEAPRPYVVPIGVETTLPLTLPHGGLNVLRIETPMQEGELTDQNNVILAQINGVRDRLSVLLVSGEPHAGERTWRNLLKSDSAVDLVHFTILRPPEKQDMVPVEEVSLIAFPVYELFVEKIGEFDLIIFDRYSQRSMLPTEYYDNIRTYIENGGAVLIAAGPEFASVESLSHSAFGMAIPAVPTALVREGGFRPDVTDVGHKHPVTAGLDADFPPREGETTPGWGEWLRMVEVEPMGGETLLAGPDELPLLILDRVGEGRVALLASDQAWLWARGYDGGGPQLELLRRLAHWLMKEPDLEEEALTASADGQKLTITRRTLEDREPSVTLTAPDGAEVILPMEEISPGTWLAEYAAPSLGLYALKEGELEAVAAVGPASAREYEETVATDALVGPMTEAGLGGVLVLSEDSDFALRSVREGRPAIGRGWIGITPRGGTELSDLRLIPLVWPLLALLIVAALALTAWLREGRSEKILRS